MKKKYDSCDYLISDIAYLDVIFYSFINNDI